MSKPWLCLWIRSTFWVALLLGCGLSRSFGADLASPDNPPPPRLGLDSHVSLLQTESRIWERDVGSGFRKGAHEAGFALGAGFGLRERVVGASKIAHDLALATAHYGWVFTDVVGRDHWYGGNWELLGEGFAGAQFSPSTAYLAGGIAVLRYDFRTGTRWVPFMDLGAGCLATDIKGPDLSTVFQFNVQAGPGVHYFWRKNSAITFQFRYMHISNAGIKHPNSGVNTCMFYTGMSWFF